MTADAPDLEGLASDSLDELLWEVSRAASLSAAIDELTLDDDVSRQGHARIMHRRCWRLAVDLLRLVPGSPACTHRLPFEAATVVGVSRAIYDCRVSHAYLSDPTIPDDEWRFRLWVAFRQATLEHQETVAHMAKHGAEGSSGALATLDKVSAMFLAKIQEHRVYQALDEKSRGRLDIGRHAPMHLRPGQVLRQTGETANRASRVHDSFSSHIHSHPATSVHHLQFDAPLASQYQEYLKTLECTSIASASNVIRGCTYATLELFPDARDAQLRPVDWSSLEVGSPAGGRVGDAGRWG